MGKMHAEGVTLIEMMVTLVVLAVVLAAGVPTFLDFMANNRMSAAANDFVTSLHLARSEAIKRRTTTAICPRAGDRCDPDSGLGKGWLVFVDRDNDGLRAGDGEIIIQRRGPLDGKISDGGRWMDENGGTTERLSLAFTPDGYLAADIAGSPPTAHIQLCDDRGGRQTIGGAAAGRWIHVSATGRPRVYSSHEAVEESPQNPLGGCG